MFKKILCFFGKHKWFWESIHHPDKYQNRVWDNLAIRVCVRCGCMKGVVFGNDDKGLFNATDEGKKYV